MAAQIHSSMFLFDVPPTVMETFCKIIDSGDGSMGWRALASRILPNWLEMRYTERLEAAGKSPTRELLWSWAQKNKTVGDLLAVLEDMGHERAVHLLSTGGMKTVSSTGNGCIISPKENTVQPQYSLQAGRDADISETTHDSGLLCYLNSSANGGKVQRYRISYSDVIMATQNFHQSLKIGEGAFSEVYKGVKGNQTFAVKMLKQEKKDAWKKLWNAFRTEIEVLHLYQHPNILELWGCFSDGDRYCVVTPYLPNGSLCHRLHGQGAGLPLSWQERLGIIKGTARAVTHLHTTQPCSVICGNITSANILLDDQLQPKLSDFGMACLRPHSVNQTCTIAMDAGSLGTLGYLPEEYIRDGKLSVKQDVYSFGVVVMETLTGLRPVLETPKHILLRDMLCREVEESGGTDVCLCHLDGSAGRWPHAMALCLFRLAMECTSGRPRSRPHMSAALQVLSQLLPLPCLPEDQPRTLDSTANLTGHQGAGASLPVEDDETSPPLLATQDPGPCECSQSEVTYLGEQYREREREAGAAQQDVGVRAPAQSWRSWPSDLYGSWPVQCSCAAEENGQECEDCRANGFTPSREDATAGGDTHCSQKQEVVENVAKERFRDKIQLYNSGLLNTEELLSMELVPPRPSPGNSSAWQSS
ncbi:interleukin-1 receptor-associated kinase 3 [Megalops cyprinoides]|uniref:interleukin-1 receptor-associated kinase 3 n=1 Tax=Megalops cyprinoides TaxID=118141 RepID=UPI0018650281|nr:interleukin-1 receptor-associated kinase 3 [Megalops cyprinoides]